MDLLSVLGVKIDPSGAKRGANEVNRALNSMSARAKRTATSMRTSINSVGGLIAKLGALTGGLSVGFAVKSALSEFKNFEQGMKNVAAVAGATDSELRQLSNTALDLARATKFTPKEATEGLYSLASAGLNAQEQMAALPNVLNLAQAAQADLGQTTEVTVALMNNFGLSADETGRIVDVLTASIGASAQNMDRLMTSLRNGGPTAAAFGQDMEESIAAINILTTAFGNGELAGTGFAAVLRLMMEKGDEFGISVKDSAGNLRPLVDIIRDMEEAGISSARAIEVFGARGGPALALLLQKGSKAIEDMTAKIQSSGQAAKVATEQMDTLQGDLDQMFSALDALQIRLGADQAPWLRTIVQGITEFINLTTDNLPRINAEFAILGEEWKKVADLIGEGLDIIWTGIKNLLDYEPSDSNFFVFMLRSLQELPVNAEATFSILKAHFTAFVESFGPQLDILKQYFKNAWDQIVLWFQEMLLKMKLAWATFKTDLGTTLMDIAGIPAALRPASTSIADVTAELRKLGKERDKQNKQNDEIIRDIENEKDQIKARKDAAIEEAFAVRQAELDKQNARRETARLNQEMDEVLQEVTVTAKRMQDATSEATESASDDIKKLAEDWADMWEKQAEDMEAAIEEEKRLWDSLMNHMSRGQIKYFLAEAIKEGFEKGAKEGWDFIKKGFEENPAGFFAGATNLATEFFQRSEYYNRPNALGLSPYGSSLDGEIRALWDTIAPFVAMAGPWGAAIAAVVTFVDEISGGKLFGTPFELIKSGYNLGVGPEGITGDQFTQEERERSFFRGTKTRITVSDLDEQIKNAVKDLFDVIQKVMLDTARIFAVDIPEMVSGTFEQEFDANGRLTKTLSTVRGRQYEEDFESFTKRLTAENILAVLAQKAGEVEVQQTLGNAFSGDAAVRWDPSRLGVGPYTNLMQPGISAGVESTTILMNEVDAIAERWRHDAELLLEGAQFLALMMGDLEDGFNLLGEGTLTEITDLIEDMAFSGEDLASAYARVATSTKFLERAVDLLGVELDYSREAFVRFATDITTAAGGIEEASRLWASFFSNYTTQTESIGFQIQQIAAEVATLEEQLGIGGVTFENFRRKFEEALPTLSADEVVLWLRLGDALARGNALVGEFASDLTKAVEALGSVTTNFEASQMSLTDQLNLNASLIEDVIRAWDGTAESERRLTELVQERYDLEFALLERMGQVLESINNTIDQAIEGIELSRLSEQGQYEYYKGEAERLRAELPFLTTPEDVDRWVQDITRYATSAYNVPGQEANAQWFIDFLEGTRQDANMVLEKIGQENEDRTSDLIDKISSVYDKKAAQEQQIVSDMKSAAATMQGAANTMVTAANAIPRTINSAVTVRVVHTRDDEYDVGGL
jgi:TP901 family phage tail tape measure protein